ncbi:MAG: Gfo/Idh/MocA family oxidoreductase [Caldilineaceae bacterium]|nr:Gfo/Idh/MocA family oxidoreductase [Caldilineaceae bacterium]
MALTVLLAGLSHPHSLAHLRTLAQTPEVDTILLWDADPQVLALEEVRGTAKVAAVNTDLPRLLAEHSINFALVAERNDRMPALCQQIARAGVHLLVEKPIGNSPAAVTEVISAADRAGVRLGVCYTNRCHPLVEEAKRAIDGGLLGPLMTLHMQLLTTQPRFRNPGHWLFSKEIAGGGILPWLGCHYLDLMRFITGDEIVAVSAHCATRSGGAIDVEDVAALSLTFASGGVGSLHVGYVLALSGAGYENRQGYATHAEFCGQFGRLGWSGSTIFPPHLWIESAHPDWAAAPRREFHADLAPSTAYAGAHGLTFLRRFTQAIQDGSPLPASGEDALAVARVVESAYASVGM